MDEPETVPGAGSARPTWLQASAVMVTATLFSRILGILRDTVIAYLFGQNQLTDAYRAAFQLPDFLFFMVAGGAMSSALIPVFSEYFNTDRREEAWRIYSSVINIMVAITIVLVGLGEVFTGPLVHVMLPGLSPDTMELTVRLTRIVLPIQIFFVLGGLMMATLYARHHFIVPALGPNIYNLGIIFGGVTLAGTMGIAGLAWGAALGALIGNVLLPQWMMGRLGSKYAALWDVRNPGVRQVFRIMIPIMLGLGLPGMYMLVLRGFASGLGEKAISILDNANRQMQAPLGIVGQAIAIAIFPTLAELAGKGDRAGLRAILRQGLRLVWYITLPATALMFVFAADIGRVLLQYGKFHAADTEMVAAALKMFSLGLFGWSGQAMITRAFYSLNDSLTPVLIGTVVTAGFVPLAWLFVGPMGMGFRGLALATSIAATIMMAWMYWVLRRRLPSAAPGTQDGRSLGGHLLLCAAASAAIGALCAAIRTPVEKHALLAGWPSHLTSLALLLGLGGTAMLLYLWLTKWLGLSEPLYIARLFSRRPRTR